MLASRRHGCTIVHCVNNSDIYSVVHPYYLRSDAPRSRLDIITGYLERGIREVVWGLSLLKPRDVMNLGLWVLIMSGLSTTYHYSGIGPVSSAARQIKQPGTAQVSAPVHETAVTTLPAGPTGQSLPPGVMAPIYTYANSYVRGQCTWYVAGRRQIPDHWGDARSWYSRAVAAGWSVGQTPAIAAIAWTSAGPRGHVALVEAIENDQVLISEMNYLGPYKFSKRWVPITSFKYIY